LCCRVDRWYVRRRGGALMSNPVPKRRHSNQRTRKRRTHYKTDAPGVSKCPQCQEPKAPHRVCPHCGFYNGKKRIEVEVEG